MKVKVSQLCPTLCDPVDYTVHGILQARILEWVAIPFSRGTPNQGNEPRSPALQADSLPAESQGKTKITGVGSQSLLQQIILTQESNWGLLHFRQIFYQLNYQGNPRARQFIFRNFIISFQKWSEACCYLALTHVGCQAHFLFVFVF